MVAKADNYLLQYYFNGTAATVKIYNNSIFGLIGIPMRFNLIIIQALLLLSIGLNFLLIYKVFKQ